MFGIKAVLKVIGPMFNMPEPEAASGFVLCDERAVSREERGREDGEGAVSGRE